MPNLLMQPIWSKNLNKNVSAVVHAETKEAIKLGSGFLPINHPVMDFPDSPALNELINISKKLSCLIKGGIIINILDELVLPELNTLELNYQQLVRIHAIGVSLAHAYQYAQVKYQEALNGTDEQPVTLPENFSKWLVGLSTAIDRRPVQTYESYILQNYQLKDSTVGFKLSNIMPLITYSGREDEAWFIKVHVYAEHLAGAVLQQADKLQQLLNKNLDDQGLNFIELLITTLKRLNSSFASLNGISGQMQSCAGVTRLSVNDYFSNIRPFLTNHEHGIVYSGCNLLVEQPVLWRGASGAQSSILPALDRILQLDVMQLDTMVDMINYMPPEHQCYLANCQQANSNLFELCKSSNNLEVVDLYRQAIKQVIAFRRKHYLLLVVPFIVEQKVKLFVEGIDREICLLCLGIRDEQHKVLLKALENILAQFSIRFKMQIILFNQEELLKDDSEKQLQNYFVKIKQQMIKFFVNNHVSKTGDDFLDRVTNDFLNITIKELKDYQEFFSLEDRLQVLELVFRRFVGLSREFNGTGGVDFSYFLPNNIEQCLQKVDLLATLSSSPHRDSISRFMYDRYIVNSANSLK